MFTAYYVYVLAVLTSLGLLGDPALTDDYAITNTRSAPVQAPPDWTNASERRAHRADGLEGDIYNGF